MKNGFFWKQILQHILNIRLLIIAVIFLLFNGTSNYIIIYLIFAGGIKFINHCFRNVCNFNTLWFHSQILQKWQENQLTIFSGLLYLNYALFLEFGPFCVIYNISYVGYLLTMTLKQEINYFIPKIVCQDVFFLINVAVFGCYRQCFKWNLEINQ